MVGQPYNELADIYSMGVVSESYMLELAIYELRVLLVACKLVRCCIIESVYAYSSLTSYDMNMYQY